MRPVQYFTPETLERCRAMKPEQILRFLDGFRRLGKPPVAARSRLISLKVPEDLLEAFKADCARSGVRYQTRIKELMREGLAERHSATE